MKKNIIFTFALGLLVITSIVNIRISSNQPVASGKVDYIVSDINQLAKDSEVIVIGIIANDKTNICLNDVDFVISSLKVSKIIKGNEIKKNNINILQTKDIDIDPELQNNDKVLLFLEKYSGPITDDAYTIKGLYQGNYKIKNEKLIESKNKQHKIINDINGKNVLEVINNLSVVK